MELQLCSEYHIRHSEFLKWEPEDRAKAIAYMLEKAERCQMCGTAKWEWDPEQGGNRFAYEAAEEICQGCLRKAAVQETSGSQPGTNVILIPTNTVHYAKHHKAQERRWLEDMKRLAAKQKRRT